MAKKTVFRRCAKWLPLSPELRTALSADDEDYSYKEDKKPCGTNDNFAKEIFAEIREDVAGENVQESAENKDNVVEAEEVKEAETESKESLL
jgi:recombinational DNA repair protein RecT